MKKEKYIQPNGEILIKEFHKDGLISYRNMDNKLHRTDGGPAVETKNNSSWWFKGELHREDGPATIDKHGFGEVHRFYLYDTEYTKDEYDQLVLKLKLDRLKKL